MSADDAAGPHARPARPARSGVALAAARRVITTEARALDALAASLGEPFSVAVDTLETTRGRVVLAGVGKSGHVARKIAATMASTGTPAQFVHPTEASHGDLGMIAQGDSLLALSKSGETQELGDLIHFTRRFGIPLIAMTTGATSTLARAADTVLLLPDVPEACAETSAPTTSTTLMMALGDALAVALLERRGFTADSFRHFHPGGKLGAMLKRVKDLMHTRESIPLIAQGSSLADGLNVLSAKGFGCVGVCDRAGRLTGLVTDGDIRRLVARAGQAANIDDVMTRSPLTVTPETLASNALRLMNERKISQFIVVDADQMPVGVIHLHDFLKAGVA